MTDSSSVGLLARRCPYYILRQCPVVGYVLWVQAKKWMKTILEALDKGKMGRGAASKLAGKLQWGVSALFRRLGRAQLRPIYDQSHSPTSNMGSELRRSLLWWLKILEKSIAETRCWADNVKPPVHLFCDAAGHPAKLAATLYTPEEGCLYTALCPTEQMLQLFKRRGDNQIMGLELLSISLGLCTFEKQLRGRRVVIHSDNTGSEVALRKGTARSHDHAQLVHHQWFQAACKEMELHVVRVKTDDNIADLPSRSEHRHVVLWFSC